MPRCKVNHALKESKQNALIERLEERARNMSEQKQVCELISHTSELV